MAHSDLVTTLHVSPVAPSPDSPQSASPFSLPLTFFDILWFKFHPVERIFFYKLPESTPSFFDSVVLPKLKHSLSLTLLHFLPLAGKLTWDPLSPKPIILYTPNDAVSVTVAESNADFHHLAGDEPHAAAESHSYIPELEVSESEASIIALQITNFPNQGFCIGISSHHAILDGKSVTMFLKAWAQVSKEGNLSPELIPFYDRTVIQDPEEIAMEYLKNWAELNWPGLDMNPRSLNLLPGTIPQQDLVRATFTLSREEIKKLREKVLSQVDQDEFSENPLHLSSFVLTHAYITICRVKAKELQKKNRPIVVGFIADCRARLDPPIPANYFGNCVVAPLPILVIKAEEVVGDDGISVAAKWLSGVIRGLERGALEGMKERFKRIMSIKIDEVDGMGVAGSPRFEVYKTDFGWGRPEKVELTSIDRTGSISMAESRDGKGGIEVGVVLEEIQQMDRFCTLFVSGLTDS